MPQVKPEITAVISKAEITPPAIKVIIPIPLKIYKIAKPIAEIRKTLDNMAFNFPCLNKPSS